MFVFKLVDNLILSAVVLLATVSYLILLARFGHIIWLRNNIFGTSYIIERYHFFILEYFLVIRQKRREFKNLINRVVFNILVACYAQTIIKIMLLLLSGDIELNPGDTKRSSLLTFGIWNVDSLLARKG